MTDIQETITLIYQAKKTMQKCTSCKRLRQQFCAPCASLLEQISVSVDRSLDNLAEHDIKQLTRLAFDALSLRNEDLSIKIINRLAPILKRQDENAYSPLVSQAIRFTVDGRIIHILDQIKKLPLTTLKDIALNSTVLDDIKPYTISDNNLLQRLKNDKKPDDIEWHGICANIANHNAIQTLKLLSQHNVLNEYDYLHIQRSIRAPKYMNTPNEWREMVLSLIALGLPVDTWDHNHLYAYLFIGRQGQSTEYIEADTIISKISQLNEEKSEDRALSSALLYIAANRFNISPTFLFDTVPSWQHASIVSLLKKI